MRDGFRLDTWTCGVYQGDGWGVAELLGSWGCLGLGVVGLAEFFFGLADGAEFSEEVVYGFCSLHGGVFWDGDGFGLDSGFGRLDFFGEVFESFGELSSGFEDCAGFWGSEGVVVGGGFDDASESLEGVLDF